MRPIEFKVSFLFPSRHGVSSQNGLVETLDDEHDWRVMRVGVDSLPKSRFLRFVERAVVLARRAGTRFSTGYSQKRFTLREHVVLLCLKTKKTTTYRDPLDELIEMARTRDALDLDWIPPPSTLCKAFDRPEMAV